MKQIITINALPVSYNKVLTAHWAERRRLKQEWELLTLATVKEQRIKPIKRYPVRVTIQLFFRSNHRHDLDNYASQKGILDGLVSAGIIKDDCIKYIPRLIYEGYYSQVDCTLIILKDGK